MIEVDDITRVLSCIAKSVLFLNRGPQSPNVLFYFVNCWHFSTRPQDNIDTDLNKVFYVRMSNKKKKRFYLGKPFSLYSYTSTATEHILCVTFGPATITSHLFPRVTIASIASLNVPCPSLRLSENLYISVVVQGPVTGPVITTKDPIRPN